MPYRRAHGILRDMSEQRKTTYPGGFPAILAQMEGRRDPFSYHEGEALAPLDTDFAALKQQYMLAEAPELGDSRSGYARKYRALAEEFAGRSALLHLHGVLIAHLRRRSQPAHTAALFQRLWAEEATYLMDHLDARWLVSAATTFGDHGANELQRSVGHALSVLFGMMKLYETERLYAAVTPDQPHPWRKRSSPTLAMEMDAFAVGGAGGLDVNMLGRLWQQGSQDEVIAPLVQRLLTLLVDDDKTVFRRLHIMRARKAKQRQEAGKEVKPQRAVPADKRKIIAPVPHRQSSQSSPCRWGTVSLIKAPTRDILAFAAYHLDLGAHHLHIYLDEPDETAEVLLRAHPKITVTICDGTYWNAQKKPRMKTHRMRQVWVATQAYNVTECDWLAHVDVDEFILPEAGKSVDQLLAEVPDDHLGLMLQSADQLAAPGPEGGEAFKLTHLAAGHKRAVLGQIYTSFGSHLPGGFIGHISGKLILRTGLDGLRFGIHACHWQAAQVENITNMTGSYIGHAHAASWSQFRKMLEFRLTRGSYQRAEDNDRLQLGDVIDLVLEEGGEDALRAFYEEVNGGGPELRAALARHNMLIDQPLHLEARMIRVFGNEAKVFL
ncbi:glycosyltransferase family 2 protein [Thalassobius sp. Cn5-15]|uniref:glycosyltransferase family 2 protein n=1 Tax=Thalassobius sp. Cn5-15 TaxID=2917763 RepID=UPI001EF3082F|nr:glycosyltransferase family 2 protein [Thalassobius sp. Cn5-15]MCG7492884.1 glycosyltransferase family 2 protein [Thalassobius sp. Cn5-15]